MPSRTIDPQTIDAVLFDLDGTLIETNNRWIESLAHRLEPLRRLFPRMDTEAVARQILLRIEMPGNYVVSTIERLGLSVLTAGVADRMRRSRGLATREQSRLIEGSEWIIETLAPHYKLAVVTTRARPEAEAFVKRAGFERYFSVVITRGDMWRMKPHPAPVLEAARCLGVAPERCLLVGDTMMDVLAAKRAGAAAVGVLSGSGNRAELEAAGADLILERAAALAQYLLPDKKGEPHFGK